MIERTCCCLRDIPLQSWLCGKLLQLIDSEAVALHSSRGYETGQSKAWMRLSVIAFDVLGDPQALIQFVS